MNTGGKNNTVTPMTQVEGYEAYVREKENGNIIQLRITGAHCAGCIQKIESTLSDMAGIGHVRLNFTSGALTIEWTGEKDLANHYVSTIQSLGYGVHPYENKETQQDAYNKFLLMCMGVSGFAAGNIMLLSFGLWITDMQTMGETTREFLHWVSSIIAVPAVIFSGRPFFQSAWKALSHRRTNMDVPISLALILATGMSVHELFRGAEHVYFDSALMLCFFLLVGRYLDHRTRAKARHAASGLMETLQGFASVIISTSKTKKIPIKDLRPDMMVQVAVGEKIPVDGVIDKGETELDMALVTGETTPFFKQKGDEVFAGTVNLSNPILMRVSKASSESLLADIVRLMEKAEQGQAAYTRLADRAAALYTPVVHIMAAAAFILQFLIWGQSWQDALMIAVTVLIITCPCALGLAVPVAQVLATSRLLARKILVKSGDALERLAVVTSIFMDKTGTITKGTPELVGHYDEGHLKFAASLARYSAHPFSQAITVAYQGAYITIENVKEHAGQGMEAVLSDGRSIRLGRHSWCGGDAGDASTEYSEIWMRIEGEAPVCFHVADQIRPDAREVITAMKHPVTLISGDHQKSVMACAKQVGIDQAIFELTPKDKYNVIMRAKENNEKTLMIGDGLNDAPVLAAADISIAPGTAIDMTQNVADIVFMEESFSAIQYAYDTAVKTQRIIRENFAISIVYNIIAVPLAFMGMVTPMVAAIAMSGSSLLVILNSLRLKWSAS